MKISNIPADFINSLFIIAEKLNISDKDAFISRVLQRLGAIVDEYPETIFWTITGYMIGKFIDHLLTIPIIGIPITGGIADGLCALAGFIHGFNKDMEKSDLGKKIRIILAEEICRAKSF